MRKIERLNAELENDEGEINDVDILWLIQRVLKLERGAEKLFERLPEAAMLGAELRLVLAEDRPAPKENRP